MRSHCNIGRLQAHHVWIPGVPHEPRSVKKRASVADNDSQAASAVAVIAVSLKSFISALSALSQEHKSSLGALLPSELGVVESKKRSGGRVEGRIASSATTVAKLKAVKRRKDDDAPSAMKAYTKTKASKTTEGVKENSNLDLSDDDHQLSKGQRSADPHLRRDTTGMYRSTFVILL